VGSDDETGRQLASRSAHPSSLARSALRRQTPKVGAGCSNWARPDPCGGCPAMGIPTAILGRFETLPRLAALSPTCRLAQIPGAWVSRAHSSRRAATPQQDSDINELESGQGATCSATSDTQSETAPNSVADGAADVADSVAVREGENLNEINDVAGVAGRRGEDSGSATDEARPCDAQIAEAE
jgi:hypothetical protein